MAPARRSLRRNRKVEADARKAKPLERYPWDLGPFFWNQRRLYGAHPRSGAAVGRVAHAVRDGGADAARSARLEVPVKENPHGVNHLERLEDIGPQFALDVALGSSAETMTWSQMTLRAILIFVYGVVVFRFAYRRFFGQSTDFDIVMAVLIGSAMSRTLTGNAPLVPTLAATTHPDGVAWRAGADGVALGVGRLAHQGRGIPALIDKGRMDRRATLRSGVTERDLLEPFA